MYSWDEAGDLKGLDRARGAESQRALGQSRGVHGARHAFARAIACKRSRGRLL